MHQPTFLLGVLLVISSFLLFGYNFTSGGNGSTHLVGIGILLCGGLLIGISKAMRKAAENVRSLIDEMIDMQGTPKPKSKTKTIIVYSGVFAPHSLWKCPA
jgi:hypothetical protein